MNAQTAAKHATSPQTPPLPQAKPEAIGLSPSRLQKFLNEKYGIGDGGSI